MSDRFFRRFAPYIIMSSIFILHMAGFFISLNISRKFLFLVWLTVAAIDMCFGFKCGNLIHLLYDISYTDSLTGANNRYFFYTEIISKLKKLENDGVPVSLLMLDIDNFKRINDNYGHIAGDKIVKQIASIIFKNIHHNDTLIRWGGDEFLIILPRATVENAYKIAEKIRQGVESESLILEDINLKTTVSIGTVSISEKINIETFINLADKALYKAKTEKNKVINWPGLLK